MKLKHNSPQTEEFFAQVCKMLGVQDDHGASTLSVLRLERPTFSGASSLRFHKKWGDVVEHTIPDVIVPDVFDLVSRLAGRQDFPVSSITVRAVGARDIVVEVGEVVEVPNGSFLSEDQFDALADIAGLRPTSKGFSAVKEVLCKGLPISEAAQMYGIRAETASNMKHKITAAHESIPGQIARLKKAYVHGAPLGYGRSAPRTGDAS